MRVIRNEPTTRVTKRNSTRELDTVDQGNHPSAKRGHGLRNNRLSNARTGLGPGVFIPGAGMRRIPTRPPRIERGGGAPRESSRGGAFVTGQSKRQLTRS